MRASGQAGIATSALGVVKVFKVFLIVQRFLHDNEDLIRCRSIFDFLIEMLLFNIALHQTAPRSRVFDCKKGRGVSGTKGFVQVVQPHLTLVPSNSLLAGSVGRGDEKNRLFCIILHCIAINTLSCSIYRLMLFKGAPLKTWIALYHSVLLSITPGAL